MNKKLLLLLILAIPFCSISCGDDHIPKTQETTVQTKAPETAPLKAQPEPEAAPADTDTESTEKPEAAVVTKTPIMLEFTQETCLPCKIMEPWVTKLKKNFKGQIEVTKIDIDKPENVSLQRYFRVTSVPTQVYINRFGGVVETHVGMARYPEMKRVVETKLGLKPNK